MIVYRNATRTVQTGDVLVAGSLNSPEQALRFLIHFGEIEAAIVDELCPEQDTITPEIEALRRVSECAGRVFISPCAEHSRELGAALANVRLPDRSVKVNVPEGYAFYGLCVHSYADAARRFVAEHRPREVAVIGIRSIGTSLSAVAGAAMQAIGCRVHTFTVRPHGHPFDRELRLSADFEARWRALRHADFAIVDEGPGLSGSSFASVVRKLGELGVPPRQIALFPSWNTSGDNFVSEDARTNWASCARYVGESREITDAVDISAGKWRPIFYGDEAEFPVIHPQHEARKYLKAGSRGTELWKFAGHGYYGEQKVLMARELSDAGHSPVPLGVADGFLRSEFVAGQPLNARCRDAELFETMARYLAFRARRFPVDQGTPLDELVRMTEFNSGAPASAPKTNKAVAVDGRMLPHEWILTARGYLKTDAVDHWTNHFYPGATDIAWDLACTILEFGLDEREASEFVRLYERFSGERDVDERLPFFRQAYLAFRLGYATLAKNTFHEFGRVVQHYRTLLDVEVSRTACK